MQSHTDWPCMGSSSTRSGLRQNSVRWDGLAVTEEEDLMMLVLVLVLMLMPMLLLGLFVML